MVCGEREKTVNNEVKEFMVEDLSPARGSSLEESSSQSWEEKRDKAVQILEAVANDVGTPRNIRRAAKAAADELFNEKYTPAVRAANAIEMIEEIINDPNMPVFTRTQLWMAISILETIRSMPT